MDFKDLAKANDMAAQLTKLKEWLKVSWKSSEPDCRMAFIWNAYPGDDDKNMYVDIPFAPAREAVKLEIDRITAELTRLGVKVD